METKHTPGPMVTEYKAGFTMEGNTIIVMNAERYPFAFVPAWDDPRPGEENGEEEAKANARLIAAAPDLLEALLECRDAEMRRRAKLKPGAPATTYTEERLGRINAAIARATGVDQ